MRVQRVEHLADLGEQRIVVVAQALAGARHPRLEAAGLGDRVAADVQRVHQRAQPAQRRVRGDDTSAGNVIVVSSVMLTVCNVPERMSGRKIWPVAPAGVSSRPPARLSSRPGTASHALPTNG